jgi:hypothetical protein
MEAKHAPGAPAPLCPFPIPKNIFTRIHCDHVGPFPETREGYKFCLTIVCAFSLFPELIPVKTQTAEETADAIFEHIFARYGTPETVYTDKGTAFSNAIMKALTKLIGANLYSSSSAHPQANSRAESMNYNISKTLKTLIKDQTDWAKLLPAVCLSYRSTPTVAHGFTPAKLVYGFDPPLPINLTLINEVNTTPEVDVYLRDLITRLEIIRDAAKLNLEEKNEKTKSQHDTFAKYPAYHINSKVYLYDKRVAKGHSPKLSKSWAGPYEIVEAFDNFVYKLRNCRTGKLIKSRIHSNRLKPYTERRQLPPRQAELVSNPTANETLRPPSTQVESNANTSNADAHSITPTTGNDVQTVDSDSIDATQSYSQRQSSNGQSNENETAVKLGNVMPENTQMQQNSISDSQNKVAAPNGGSTPEADETEAENAEYYTVKKVTKKRMIGGKPYYLVYWQEGGSSWECEENLNELALKSYSDAVKQRTNARRNKRRAKAITLIYKSY